MVLKPNSQTHENQTLRHMRTYVKSFDNLHIDPKYFLWYLRIASRTNYKRDRLIIATYSRQKKIGLYYSMYV
jgi:hypothetical protein